MLVDSLDTDEGRAFGISAVGDMNDRSDYSTVESVTFQSTRVQKLHAGHGKQSFPVRLGENELHAQGVSTDVPIDNHNNFRLPKTFVMYEGAGSILDDHHGWPVLDNSDPGVVDRWMARTSFNTEEKLLVGSP